jgi:hypothetical protein
MFSLYMYIWSCLYLCTHLSFVSTWKPFLLIVIKGSPYQSNFVAFIYTS